MRTVWKFTLAITDGEQTLLMPHGAEVVHVAIQHDQLTLWAVVLPDLDTVARYFQVTGTGHPAPADGRYLGTTTELAGLLVWHVWETSR